jgi:regulatory protein
LINQSAFAYSRGCSSHGCFVGWAMAGTISALVVQKKNKERVNVYLDGRFAFGLAAIEAVKLKRGQTLSDEEIAALQARDELEWARQQALGLLERRPRSVEEIRRYLGGKGYPLETVEQVIERLAGAGLLDDRAFARFWLENRKAFRPRGARALRYELRQKGVPEELIAELLESEHDEDQAAYQAALPKARRWRGLEEREFYTKLQGYLARRGFSYDVARDTILRAWQAVHAEAPDQDF